MWFPGSPPGNAKTAATGGEYVLENDVIAARWQIEAGVLPPAALVNKLSATSFDQTGAELFRLGLSLNHSRCWFWKRRPSRQCNKVGLGIIRRPGA